MLLIRPIISLDACFYSSVKLEFCLIGDNHVSVRVDRHARLEPNIELLKKGEGLHGLSLGGLVLEQVLRRDAGEETLVFVGTAVDNVHDSGLVAVQV